MSSPYPGAVWKPVNNHGGLMTSHVGVVLHVQEDNGGLQGWFNNPASGVSSHFWISKAGVVEQYVDTDVVAWAQAAGNASYLSVETEGFTTEALTEQQVDQFGKLFRWCVGRYSSIHYAEADVPGQSGLGWHGMGGVAWGNHPGCPGDLRKAQRPVIIQKAQGSAVPTPQPQPTPVPNPYEPAPGATYPPFPGRLIYLTNPLMSGNDIRMWQQQMSARHWTITIDGVYGPQSETICKQFQTEKKLTVDGIVGPQTWIATWTYPVT